MLAPGAAEILEGRRDEVLAMRATVFQSHPLPRGVAAALQRRLEAAHRAEPFSALDPRAAVRRVIAEATDLGLRTTVYRGGLDLQGAEVDHVWLALEVGPVASGDRRTHGSPYVVDVAFPVFMHSFVDALRRFVAGDAEAEELATLAARAGLEERVVGVFPAPLRYVGAPLWSVLERRRSGDS